MPIPLYPSRRQWLCSAGLLALGGCATLMSPPTRVPMHVLRPPGGRCDGRAPVLLVMLPGAWSRPPEFVDEGFVAAVRSRGLAADVAIADAHLGYFNDRSVLTRLREDVVLPARAQGYRSIWLVGISLGGFAALGYAAHHPDEVDGLVVIAPYLGRPQLLQEIAAAGGPMAWRVAPHPAPTPDEPERTVWEWLTARAAAPDAPATTRLPLYLGHGRDDRFAAAHRLLAGVLPAGRSVDLPGGHAWSPWRALWSHWLDRGLLPGEC
jgi:pimeloyl-ACP methyl ester carboxylesterase